MSGSSGATMQCNTCGTQFSASDAAEAENHVGHDVVSLGQNVSRDPGG